MTSQGSGYSWCGCRDKDDGRRKGARCPLCGQERHGSWYLSLELPTAPDGSRRRIRRGGFPSRQGAETALGRLHMPSSCDPDGMPLMVGHWLEHWPASPTAPRSSTLRGYAAHVRLYLTPCLAAHLSALVASLVGPPGLGRNHDKYLTYADRDDADSAASA